MYPLPPRSSLISLVDAESSGVPGSSLGATAIDRRRDNPRCRRRRRHRRVTRSDVQFISRAAEFDGTRHRFNFLSIGDAPESVVIELSRPPLDGSPLRRTENSHRRAIATLHAFITTHLPIRTTAEVNSQCWQAEALNRLIDRLRWSRYPAWAE